MTIAPTSGVSSSTQPQSDGVVRARALGEVGRVRQDRREAAGRSVAVSLGVLQFESSSSMSIGRRLR